MKVLRVVAAAFVAAAITAPSVAVADAAYRGASFIVSRQMPSGAFFSADQPPDGVGEDIASLIAGGVTGASVDRALAFVATRGPDRARQNAAYAGRIILGLVAAGRNPRSFGGFDYVAELESKYKPAGMYEPQLYADSLAVLGVIAAGDPVPVQAITYFRLNECSGGGFGHDEGCASKADTDTTSLVIDVLIAAGVPKFDTVISRARTWLSETQNDDGGFGLYPGDPTNANSAALALTAIAALQERSEDWKKGNDARTALLALQFPSGGFALHAGDPKPNDYATVQGVLGVSRRALPIRPGAKTASSNLGPTRSAQPASGFTLTSPISDAGTQSLAQPSHAAQKDAAAFMDQQPATSTVAQHSRRKSSRSMLMAAASASLALSGALFVRRRFAR
ncbi:MAG: prenyltransferase/squalene oxidase repeat-containing protein [Actinomycetota bacterium]|nr:hypothetical protein [Actinomycetota bacterium]